jgi:small subunit ribosomal protein S16
MVGILEPKYRIGQVQGQVIKADSAAKSLIPEVVVHTTGTVAEEEAAEAAEAVKDSETIKA